MLLSKTLFELWLIIRYSSVSLSLQGTLSDYGVHPPCAPDRKPGLEPFGRHNQITCSLPAYRRNHLRLRRQSARNGTPAAESSQTRVARIMEAIVGLGDCLETPASFEDWFDPDVCSGSHVAGVLYDIGFPLNLDLARGPGSYGL